MSFPTRRAVGAGLALSIALAGKTVSAKILLPAQDIEWDNLQPAVEVASAPPQKDQDQLPFNDLSEEWLALSDPFNHPIPQSEEEAIEQMSRIPIQDTTAPVVKTYNGKRVRLAGYVVPLDFEATKITEFLLVPYVGACIHVPPPPSNQVVYIKSEKPVEVMGLFDPVFVTGIMQTAASKTELAEAGYRIEADGVKPYE